MTNRKAALTVFWLTPLLMFAAAETVTGNLLLIRPSGIVLNLVLYYLIYMGVWVLTGTNRGTWPVLNLALYALAAGEYFVISFRERPIMIWDVLALRTAMTVSANYKFVPTLQMVIMFLAAGLFSTLAIFFPVRMGASRPSGWKKRCKAVGGYGLVCLFSGWMLFGVLEKPLNLGVHMWDPIVNFEEEGFLLTTVLSMKNLFPLKPEGYSREEAELLLAEGAKAKDERAPETVKFQPADGEEEPAGRKREPADGEEGPTGGKREPADGEEEPAGGEKEPADVEGESAAGKETGVVPLNVICIMNESFSDPGIYNGINGETSFETDQEYLPYFHSLTENVEKGALYVPVFGAMTANTEYEFLTGNSCALTPQGSVPYQFYTKPGDDSLARIFGENGYRTVAMHPYPGYNWNRTKAYENLGFEEFLDLAWYEEAGKEITLERPRGYLSDKSDYDGIIKTVESKVPGEKLFLFNVTMQNHGGYEVDGLEAKVHVTALNGRTCAGEFPKADQYLTLMQMSDEALAYLLSWFQDYREPTMIVLFGDHQPSVETSFFEALYGARWSRVPEEEKINSFETPYLIWTNYERPANKSRGQSAFMLGNDVLLEAGIPLTGWRYQLEQVRKEYPVVHSMGAVDADGQFTEFTAQNGPDSLEPVRKLHILQYYRMFDK